MGVKSKVKKDEEKELFAGSSSREAGAPNSAAGDKTLDQVVQHKMYHYASVRP